MSTTIVQKDHPLLRSIASDVPKDMIKTSALRNIILRMKKALSGEKDGVAIAAPQIGEPVRIFVVSGKAFRLEQGQKEKDDDEKTDAQTIKIEADMPDKVFINPMITKLSRKKVDMDEGCLSVRHWYGTVRRAEKATVKALDEYGKPFERGASGLLAQIFQHEIDHLNGILFTDKAKNLQEIQPTNETSS